VIAERSNNRVAAVARRRGSRQRNALLESIKADIAANVGRRELSAVWIACRHDVSASHVRRLFAGDKTTFSDFVLTSRLLRAHELLSNADTLDRSISAIAFSLGFGDLSYFNRAFRRRFGARPSDVRAVALGENEN
jgi:transcriptional regulator GlxA family with amidase domain